MFCGVVFILVNFWLELSKVNILVKMSKILCVNEEGMVFDWLNV